ERNKISGYPIEHVYDVNHFSLFPSIGENGIDMSDEMNLSLEFNKSGPEGWDKTISFPVEQKDQIIEIFIMNEHGKTIDRHIY
ncbi:MAG: hypothetical protein KKD77_22020, partial [Gammaproteobacteria bacterium]|nr:hypothetical protein [Gammaproteobacteria bacterium]